MQAARVWASCSKRIFTWMTCCPTPLVNHFSAKETTNEFSRQPSSKLAHGGHRDGHPSLVHRIRACVPANAIAIGGSRKGPARKRRRWAGLVARTRPRRRHPQQYRVAGGELTEG